MFKKQAVKKNELADIFVLILGYDSTLAYRNRKNSNNQINLMNKNLIKKMKDYREFCKWIMKYGIAGTIIPFAGAIIYFLYNLHSIEQIEDIHFIYGTIGFIPLVGFLIGLLLYIYEEIKLKLHRTIF